MATLKKTHPAETAQINGRKAGIVTVELPNPLPRGVSVVFNERLGGYTLSATSKQGLRAMFDFVWERAHA